MKKLLILFIALGVIASPALAGPTPYDLSVGWDTYHSAQGGTFVITVNNVITNGGTESLEPGVFKTFCLETNEHIAIGGKYYGQLNTEAVAGGTGGGSPDPLSVKTAWLYSQFLDGNLTGALAINSNTAAEGLQKAIWYLEDETYTGFGEDNAWVQYATANCKWTTTRDIRVLNIWQYPNYTGNQQDMLVRIVIPAPGAILLGSIGIGLVGWLRRRRSL